MASVFAFATAALSLANLVAAQSYLRAETATCPEDNQQNVIDDCGVRYILGCSLKTSVLVVANTPAATFNECFEACSNGANGPCSAFSFSIPDQTCYLNSDGGVKFGTVQRTDLVSAIQLEFFANASPPAEQVNRVCTPPPGTDVITTSTSSTAITSETSTSVIGSPTPSSNVNPDGTCGGDTEFNCFGAPSGSCCGPYGYCGSTSDYCGIGCQAAFGECDVFGPSFSTSIVTIQSTSTIRPPFANTSTSTSSSRIGGTIASLNGTSTTQTSTQSVVQSSTVLIVTTGVTSTTVLSIISSTPGELSSTAPTVTTGVTSTTVLSVISSTPSESFSTVLIVTSGVTSTTVLPIISSTPSEASSTMLVISGNTTSTMIMPTSTVSDEGATSSSLTLSDGFTSSVEITEPTEGQPPRTATVTTVRGGSTFTTLVPISSPEVTSTPQPTGGETSGPSNSFTYPTGVTFSLTRPNPTPTANSYPPPPACPEANEICPSPDQVTFEQTTCSSDSGQAYSVNCGVAWVGEEVDEADVVLPPQKRYTLTAPRFSFCQQACDSTPTCRAINYIGDRCTLFRRVTGYQYVRGAIAAEYVPNPPPPGSSSPTSTVSTQSTTASTKNPSSTPSSNVNPNGICGGTSGFNCYGAPSGNCCGPYGYCGTGSNYCGTGCQLGFGECGSGSSSTTSSVASVTSPSGTPSPSPDYEPHGLCGYGFSCYGAPAGSCCSSSGYCGSGPEYCGDGCQPEWGTCGEISNSSTSTVPASYSSGVISITVTPVPTTTPSDVSVTDAGSGGSNSRTSTLDFSISPGDSGSASPTAPTSQPPVPTTSLCPAYDNADFSASSGGTYAVECDTGLQGTRILLNARRQTPPTYTGPDAATCMALCDTDDSCAGVNVVATGCEYYSDISGTQASQGSVALRKVSRAGGGNVSTVTVIRTACSTRRTTTIQMTQTVTTCAAGGRSCPAPAVTAMRMMRNKMR